MSPTRSLPLLPVLAAISGKVTSRRWHRGTNTTASNPSITACGNKTRARRPCLSLAPQQTTCGTRSRVSRTAAAPTIWKCAAQKTYRGSGNGQRVMPRRTLPRSRIGGAAESCGGFPMEQSPDWGPAANTDPRSTSAFLTAESQSGCTSMPLRAEYQTCQCPPDPPCPSRRQPGRRTCLHLGHVYQLS